MGLKASWCQTQVGGPTCEVTGVRGENNSVADNLTSPEERHKQYDKSAKFKLHTEIDVSHDAWSDRAHHSTLDKNFTMSHQAHTLGFPWPSQAARFNLLTGRPRN